MKVACISVTQSELASKKLIRNEYFNNDIVETVIISIITILSSYHVNENN